MQPKTNLTPAALDTLLSALEVEFVVLIECPISSGWQLAVPGNSAMPGIHYCLAGNGRLLVGDDPPIPFTPRQRLTHAVTIATGSDTHARPAQLMTFLIKTQLGAAP